MNLSVEYAKGCAMHSRRDFIRSAAVCLGSCAFAYSGVPVWAKPLDENGIRVRFLGTGVGPMGAKGDESGDWRRHTSILLDGRVLVDYTAINRETLPSGCRPEAVFYTHSHPDHYNVEAAIELGVKRVYCHESWVDGARAQFKEAVKGRAVPDVTGVAFGDPVVESGLTFRSLPANHLTGRKGERCSMYVVEKGNTRLLYAVDTCGIPREALKYAQVSERSPARPLTAIVMEATAGIGHQDDAGFFFSHSSVDTVARTVRALEQTGRYRPPQGRNVYITHLWRPHYGRQSEIDAALPSPLKAAYDGLEVVF